MSLLVTKYGKPLTISETLILPDFETILNLITSVNVASTNSFSSLSNNIVFRPIDEMANDVEMKLCDILKTIKFSLKLDEFTLRDNKALLLAYVQYVSIGKKIMEVLLFVRSLNTDTKG